MSFHFMLAVTICSDLEPKKIKSVIVSSVSSVSPFPIPQPRIKPILPAPLRWKCRVFNIGRPGSPDLEGFEQGSDRIVLAVV